MKYYYTDPLIAAYMAREFGVKYQKERNPDVCYSIIEDCDYAAVAGFILGHLNELVKYIK